MRVLIFGGSYYFGRLLIEDFETRGFDVTVFDGGQSTVPLSNSIRQIHGNRQYEDHLRRLVQSGPWDVVIDVSGKTPAVVERSVRAMAEVANRYVYVSTVKVYRDWPHAPVDETSLLWHGDSSYDPGTRTWDPDHGPMRAGCEMACLKTFGNDRLLILRLHVMLGSFEYVGPLRAWLERMRRGGSVLVPAPDRAIQPIDVRDAAIFLADQVQRGARGVFNVAAPANGLTYGTMVRTCANLAIADAAPVSELVWADEAWLIDQGVKEWTELPLWRNAPALWSVNVDRALAAGLRCRSLANTLVDVWRWLNCSKQPFNEKHSAQYGMAPAREAAMIARWRAGSAAQ